MAMKSSRSNHTFQSRREMPSGKQCSELTYEEIVKYLTGDIRLSKARSDDLFWEAVWPRLLAKGWHSEKPNDEAYRGFKNPLVFLLPGIKKYRKKLLKGGHYFDSVSDVLKKVASEPQLLVLESEENNGARISGKENGSGSEQTSDEDRGPDHHELHCYLKPRSSSDTANHMKFTIVDTTSLGHDDEPFNVRELRSLPAEMKTERPKNLGLFNHSKGGQSSIYDYLAADGKVSKSAKHNGEHALKRQGLKACSKPRKKSSPRRYSESSSARRNNFVLSLPAPSSKNTHRRSRHQSHLLIDLNVVPQAPAELEANGQVASLKVEEEGNNDMSQNSIVSVDTNAHLEGSRSTNSDAYQDEQADGNARRHSTRIRPLSTRALEALETSFCSPKGDKKRKQVGDALDEKLKVSRRARNKTSVTAGDCTIDDVVRDSDSMKSDQIDSAATEGLASSVANE